MKIRYRSSYYDDLDEIKYYLETNFGSVTSQKILDAIDDECQLLVSNPHLGKVYPEDTYFHYLIVQRKNLVFYHINEDKQEVIMYRIFDGRKNYVDVIASIVKN